jgi:hypothetical protein
MSVRIVMKTGAAANRTSVGKPEETTRKITEWTFGGLDAYGSGEEPGGVLQKK